MKKIPKKKMEKLLNEFYIDMMNSNEFQTKFGYIDTDDGFREAFEFLDKACQAKLKKYLEKEEELT